MNLQRLVLVSVVLAGCGGGGPVADVDAGSMPSDSGGPTTDAGPQRHPPMVADLESGPLTIEIFDPIEGEALEMVPSTELEGYYEAPYDVRARLRGEGNAAITELVAQSSGGFTGYFYSPLVETPEGRIATFHMQRVGGIFRAGDPPTVIGIRVEQGTPPPSGAGPSDEITVRISPPAM